MSCLFLVTLYHDLVLVHSKSEQSIFEFSPRDTNGQSQSLAKYKGMVM